MNVVTKSEAVAASVAVSLALTGTRLRTSGTRLASLSTRLKDTAGSSRLLVPGAVAAALLMLSMHPAAAQTAGGAGSLNSFLTNIANLVTGTTGQVIAVALTGIGAMFGAFSVRAFGGVVLGCAIVFSAAWIVGQITGGTVAA